MDAGFRERLSFIVPIIEEIALTCQLIQELDQKYLAEHPDINQFTRGYIEGEFFPFQVPEDTLVIVTRQADGTAYASPDPEVPFALSGAGRKYMRHYQERMDIRRNTLENPRRKP